MLLYRLERDLFTTLKGHSLLKSVCLTTGCMGGGGLMPARCNASIQISTVSNHEGFKLNIRSLET